MGNRDVTNVTSTLKYGLDSQQLISELNRTANEVMKKTDFQPVMEIFGELLALTKKNNELDYSQNQVDALESELTSWQIELLKEKMLLLGFWELNESYLARIDGEIKNANVRARLDTYDIRGGLVQSRIYELETTKTVATSFSAQLKLYEDTLGNVANRVEEALVNVIPLLRSKLGQEERKKKLSDAGKILRLKLKEMDKLDPH